MEVLGLPLAVLIGFALTSMVIELTPGPNMGYLAILSLNEGRKAGLAAVSGVALGLTIVGLAAALGLAAAISNSPFLYQILRWGGVLYMLYLAWDGWQDEPDDGPGEGEGRGRYFMRGLITNILNPKAGVFYVAVLPGFVNPTMPVMPQTIALSLVFVAIATMIHAGIVLLADSARRFLTNPIWRRRVRRVLAVMLALIALWFAWKTRQ